MEDEERVALRELRRACGGQAPGIDTGRNDAGGAAEAVGVDACAFADEVTVCATCAAS